MQHGNVTVKYVSYYFFHEGVLGYRYIVPFILTSGTIGGECSVLGYSYIDM
jgi:hypothetical protein